MAKTNNQKFEDAYKEFNTWAKEHYPKMQTMEYLEGKYALGEYANQLAYYRKIRNILTHDGYIGETPAGEMITVTDAMLKEFRKLVEEIEMPVMKKAITKIYSQSLDDKVLKAIRYMTKHQYTHIPIIEKGRVVGLFGENSTFELVSKGEHIDEGTTFRDLIDEIGIDKCKLVQFVYPSTTILECKQKFTYAIEKYLRLDVVFITANGKSNGQLKGLVTVWDLPNMR